MSAPTSQSGRGRRSAIALRYAFDDANRLLVADRSDRLQPRRILEGRVATDEANRLLYRVDATSADGYAGPKTVVLDGSWSLTPSHELALTLHGDERQARQTFFLRGALMEARSNALVFALQRRERDDLRSAQRVTLFGRWQADARNRLNFLVEHADGSEDRLTLQQGWEIGPRHELRYRYRQAAARREEHLLSFDGAWDIARADRLVYRLSGSSDSVFEFTASLQSPSLLARDKQVVYQVGIGLSGGRTRRQRVALFGAWKLNRDLSVAFEIPYAGGRVEAIRFQGAYAPSPRDRIAVALSTHQGEPLGVTVVFTRDVMRDARLFLRLQQDAQEFSAIGGIQVRF